MNATEAATRAQQHAESLGFGLLVPDTIRRGSTWWVVALQDCGPDLGLIIIEDSGNAHVEPEPFGPWFEDLL